MKYWSKAVIGPFTAATNINATAVVYANGSFVGSYVLQFGCHPTHPVSVRYIGYCFANCDRVVYLTDASLTVS